MSRIAATLIVGDSTDAEAWDQMIASLEPHVDAIFVNYNGKQRRFPYKMPANMQVGRFQWEDDFSTARNQVFGMVPRDEYDWMFWLDSDDTLEQGERLQELVQSLDTESQVVMLRYLYAYDPDTGAELVSQWRERLIRTDVECYWHYPLHEICVFPDGTQFAQRDQVLIKHHRAKYGDDLHARPRNRRILHKVWLKDPNDTRWCYYLANEIFAQAHALKSGSSFDGSEPLPVGGPMNWQNLFDKSYKLYTKVSVDQPDTDTGYIANHRRAECMRELGDNIKAIEIDLQGIKMRPFWPEAYVGICQSSMNVGDFTKARDFADLCIKVAQDPETTQVREPLTKSYTPYVLRGMARRQLEDPEGALEDFQYAYAIWPNVGLIDHMEYSKRLLAIKEQGPPPLRKNRFGSRPEQSIAFFTRPLPEHWDSRLIDERGSGGAEQCVVEIARRFARDGWRTVVFGTPGPCSWEQDDDGVEWYHSDDFVPTERFHTVVSSRAPEIFDSKLNCERRILWAHDVNFGPEVSGAFGNRFDRLDTVVALTRWHRQHLAGLYDLPFKKLAVIGNGHDPEQFRPLEDVPRHPHRFVFASSPDRGLDILLTMWPRIRERWPDAQLMIFYGWSNIDKLIAAGHQPLTSFKQEIVDMIDFLGGEEGGILSMGRRPRSEIAFWLNTCTAWLYPTTFMETFCNTAIEMQACGVIPVVSGLAALNETVAVPAMKIPGHAKTSKYQDHFLNSLAMAVESTSHARASLVLQGVGHASQYTWGDSMNKWRELVDIRVPLRATG